MLLPRTLPRRFASYRPTAARAGLNGDAWVGCSVHLRMSVGDDCVTRSSAVSEREQRELIFGATSTAEAVLRDRSHRFACVGDRRFGRPRAGMCARPPGRRHRPRSRQSTHRNIACRLRRIIIGWFELIELDLASLVSGQTCADALLRIGERFDAVIAIAGVMKSMCRSRTSLPPGQASSAADRTRCRRRSSILGCGCHPRAVPIDRVHIG